jgi:uncharacterized protein YciI
MKRWELIVTSALLALLLGGCAQTQQPPTSVVSEGFWFIFLERGRATPNDKEAVAAMQRGHIANFERLFGEQKLFAAGPMRDPAGHKRGIVVVKAPSEEQLRSYFQPDEYVREGYMSVNAVPCIAHKPLNTVGIDAKTIEEVRIVQISRPTVGGAAEVAQDRDFLRSLVAEGKVGAWYSLTTGPVADVLFVLTTDSKTLEDLFAAHPAVRQRGATVSIWGQWLSRGVVR